MLNGIINTFLSFLKGHMHKINSPLPVPLPGNGTWNKLLPGKLIGGLEQIVCTCLYFHHCHETVTQWLVQSSQLEKWFPGSS